MSKSEDNVSFYIMYFYTNSHEQLIFTVIHLIFAIISLYLKISYPHFYEIFRYLNTFTCH